MKQELARFRVYPDGKSRYFTCILFRSRAAMVRFYGTLGTADRDKMMRKGFDACVCPITSTRMIGEKSVHKLPSLGYILFWKCAVGYPNQAHEMTHAALAFFRRCGKNSDVHIPDSNEEHGRTKEESFAYIVGDLMEQFSDGLRKRGLHIEVS
jgi:hypothetical protein